MTDQEPAKSSAESAYERVLPFGSEPKLRESYVNYFGDLRLGKILEILDEVAGIVAYKHTDGFAKDLTIVTAAVDRIDLLKPLRSDRDLRILAQVNLVGRSSMEIGISMETKVDHHFEKAVRGYFIMVARKGEKAHPIPPLKLETQEEQKRQEQAKRRKAERRITSGGSYLKQPPSQEEGALLHKLFLQRRNSDGPTPISLSQTRRQATILMHPQERNIHNKIFGGHIMRMSFETAWNVAYLFSRRRPLFLNVDHFDFLKPVEIGSTVSINAQITFTGRTSFIVEVEVEVLKPLCDQSEITNVSYYTFVAADEHGKPHPVPQIFPHTYEEGLKFLDGYRRYQFGKREQARRR